MEKAKKWIYPGAPRFARRPYREVFSVPDEGRGGIVIRYSYGLYSEVQDRVGEDRGAGLL